MSTVLLLRHGQTTWNRENRMQGWAPVSLTDTGHEQARAVGRYLASEYDVDRLVSSDLQRARETTEGLLSAGLTVEPEFSPAWRERGIGDLQGLTVAELFGGFPQYSLRGGNHHALTERPPNGESLVDVRERVLGAWAALVADPGGETVVVVTHGGPIFVVLSHLRGLDPMAAVREENAWSENGALTEVRVEDATATLVSENVTVHGAGETSDD